MSERFDGFEAARLRVGGVGLNLRHNLGASAGKPALLLLHGFPQTHAMWHKVAPMLAGDFELMLLDISPTLTTYERTDMEFARAYYHWSS